MRTTAGAGAVLLTVLVVALLAAPWWARSVAHTGPNDTHLAERVHGRDVVSVDGVPVGPGWRGRFLLGADSNGRDEMVRLLYGGRRSLVTGLLAAALTLALALLAGLAAGWSRGVLDAVVSRALDALWAFPALLFAGALGTALTLGGVHVGPFALGPGSAALPILVVGVVSVPYFARPLRAEVRALREREFVLAAQAVGMDPGRVLAVEVLPNLAATLAALAPVAVANALLLEAALSFLGVGVQPPDASLGTLIADGLDRLVTAPQLVIAPGVVLTLTVLATHLVAQGLRRRLVIAPAVALA